MISDLEHWKNFNERRNDQLLKSLRYPVLKKETVRIFLVFSVESEAVSVCGAAPARRILNAEVVLFGGSLGKHHVASVELDSDQVRFAP